MIESAHLRRALKWIGGIVAVGAVLAAGFGGWMAMTYYNADLNTVGAVDFDRELDIPALAESVVEDGVRTFDLTMQRGESDLGQGSPTPTWGINGSLLGPTLRARAGRRSGSA